MPEFGGSAAEYFNALDVSDISNKMERLLVDYEHLSDLGERSRIQACKYTWDDFVSRVVQHIEMVVNQIKKG